MKGLGFSGAEGSEQEYPHIIILSIL